ncbi:MAG: hypothetical protein IJC71_01795 [Clostridia bacterium]|nr:hypothetical protein [Clostridia bacterium]
MKRWEKRGFWKRKVRSTAPAEAESDVQGALEDSTEHTENPSGETAEENWQARYEEERAAHEAFRAERDAADLRLKKERAYRKLLGECGIPEAKHDALVRLADVDAVVLGEDGAAEDADRLREAIAGEWKELIPPLFREKSTVLRGTSVTKADILAIRDRNARRAAIAENMDLFR